MCYLFEYLLNIIRTFYIWKFENLHLMYVIRIFAIQNRNDFDNVIEIFEYWILIGCGFFASMYHFVQPKQFTFGVMMMASGFDALIYYIIMNNVLRTVP